MNKVYLVAIIATMLGATGAVLVKQGMDNFDITKIPEQIKNYKLIMGMIFYFGAFALFATALKLSELSFVYPIMSLTQVFVMMYSYFLLHERVITINWIGVIFIMIGLSFTSIT